jgi:hypothetical protein
MMRVLSFVCVARWQCLFLRSSQGEKNRERLKERSGRLLKERNIMFRVTNETLKKKIFSRQKPTGTLSTSSSSSFYY